MKLQKGVFVSNRCWAYLFPSLLIVDVTIYTSLKMGGEGFLLGSYIKDENFSREYLLEGKNPLYIAVDTSVGSLVSESCLRYIRKSPNFITDYPYGESPYLRVIVVDVEVRSYRGFMEGKYSKMFDKEFLNSMPPNESLDIFQKTEKGEELFINFIKQRFDTQVRKVDITEETEFDLQWDYCPSAYDQEVITI